MAENQLGDRALDGEGSQKKENEGADKSRQKHFFFIAVKWIAISNYLLVDISAGNGRSGTGVQALLSMLA
jgi:hypothetical protein